MENMTEQFSGDKKVGSSYLTEIELRLKNYLVPLVPEGIETYHLTFCTILWSVLNLIFAFFLRYSISWLWMVSLMIVFQYITDLLDGELGRRRQTGLVKWGFFMDHFLDYIFLCSLVVCGYCICPSGLEIYYLFLLSLLGAFMAASFLSFSATNKFEIYQFGMGPTEARIVLIVINTLILIFGTSSFSFLLPLSVALVFIALVIYCHKIHMNLWQLDMQNKKEN